jgi:hypothetical protein
MDPNGRSNEQRLRDAGLEFDYFVDSAEGSALLFDEEAVEGRSEAARQRLLGDGIPLLGSFGSIPVNERSQRVQSGETGASIVGAARGLRTAISKLRSDKLS